MPGGCGAVGPPPHRTMKLTLRIVATLILIIATVAFVFTWTQVRTEQSRLLQELERRSELLSDSLQPYISALHQNSDPATLTNLAEKFSGRERLAGIALIAPDGNILEISRALVEHWGLPDRGQAVPETTSGSFRAGSGRLHVRTVPLVYLGIEDHRLQVYHSVAFIEERARRIWQQNFLRVFVQALAIALATLLVVYLNVMYPMRRATNWVRRIRMGDARLEPDRRDDHLLGPLVREVRKMASSLESARLAAEEEARLRLQSESLWTAERLKEFVRIRLAGRPIFVISNREPYVHSRKGKGIEWIKPASGLVTAIEPILKACGGTWVAQGSGDADRQTVDENDRLRVPPEEPQYTLRRVWLAKEEEDGFYYGFSNEGLWPLCHVAHTRPMFRESDWLDYEAVNRKFADALLQEMADTTEPFVLVQDYHFALLPRMIKQKRPDARIAIFWHIPWPNPESFGICPWQKEILDGMLGADLIGFHTQFHCNNFMETVDRALESRIDYEHFTVLRQGQTTSVKPFPISISFTEERPADGPVAPADVLKPHGVEAEMIGLGVDRLDYTKGILERFRAVETFLERNPRYEGKFTFVQIGAPSRSLIPRYQEFESDVQREAERINAKYKQKRWKPIVLLIRHHSQEEILPYYRAADVCLVTSLHDGMNLVAKEYVASRNDDKGVLVLSQFTGASRELLDSIVVNPYDISQLADAIRTAVEMPEAERTRRMREMRAVVRERNIYRWAADLIGDLSRIRLDEPVTPP
ncbi:MAG: hypothetical protein MOGMAGMI_02229 [Candidatus Omnitrophica bacterium]|nr:hypothetical protein [Candidatus Omnitrophota bacterium]